MVDKNACQKGNVNGNVFDKNRGVIKAKLWGNCVLNGKAYKKSIKLG